MFPFYDKNAVSLCGTDLMESRLGNFFGQHKKIKRVELKFCKVFLYEIYYVCFYISFSFISTFKKKRKRFRSMKKILYLLVGPT